MKGYFICCNSKNSAKMKATWGFGVIGRGLCFNRQATGAETSVRRAAKSQYSPAIPVTLVWTISGGTTPSKLHNEWARYIKIARRHYWEASPADASTNPFPWEKYRDKKPRFCGFLGDRQTDRRNLFWWHLAVSSAFLSGNSELGSDEERRSFQGLDEIRY